MPTGILERQRQTAPVGDSAAVSVAGVSKSFALSRHDRVQALSNISVEVEPGELLGIAGPSGCGKSTLLQLIAGLQGPDSGRIAIAGGDTDELRTQRCSLMFQRDLLFPWRTALDNAALPLVLAGRSRGDARATAAELLERFGLGRFLQARPYELSGGMRQRVAFARTLLAEKPLLLLDEPFGALDAITRAAMQEWLVQILAERRCTTLLVTHDIEEALYLCDRVAIMTPRPGRIAATLTVASPRALPRAEAVTSPDFVALRAHALELLS